MKKIVSVILILAMVASLGVNALAVSSLTKSISFTWAWDAKKIEVDNSISVVSWSGGSNNSLRSGFLVYDLPEDFKYEKIKSEVILSFAINKAELNNGTGQAPTAAVVMVDGDALKEAYSLKSGDKAGQILTDAKKNGVLLGNYKIGKYPRTSRIKNACVNEFFEKHPNVKSIGFYVTNLPNDGYSGTVGGIATQMTDFEVNFTAYTNYTNTTLNLKGTDGQILKSEEMRGSIGTIVSVPDKIEKDGKIWVRCDDENYSLTQEDTIDVYYKIDGEGREKYVEIIENEVQKEVSEKVDKNINLPKEYIASDGFVIEIEWISDNESVVSPNGEVFCGQTEQTAEIYAKMKIGKYTYVETKRFTVTVLSVDENEVEESLLYKNDFDNKDEKRGNFNGEKTSVDVSLPEKYSVCAFVRVDDITKDGVILNVGGLKCTLENGCVFGKKLTEGQWYHIALTNSACYIDAEKVCDNNIEKTDGESYLGGFFGKMDSVRIYEKELSQSVIENVALCGYNSPATEVISSRVIEGLDSVIVRVATNGYSGEGVVFAFADIDGVRHTGSLKKNISGDTEVFSVCVPNMGGKLTEKNVRVLFWNVTGGINPLFEKSMAGMEYDFGFNRKNPDCHLLGNVFTLCDKEKKLYLSPEGLKARGDGINWTAEYRNGVNKEGCFTLVCETGETLNGNFTFEEVGENTYRIIDTDTNKALTASSCDEWEVKIVKYNDIARVFASEGFFALTQKERDNIYSVSAQPIAISNARRVRLEEICADGYFDMDAETQAEKLRELLRYSPSYQINGEVTKKTTGIEAVYSLSAIKSATYKDRENNTKSGYTATATYKYDESDVTVVIYARSQNVVRSIAKGFSFMPYQFMKPLERVTDYYATNNQFKAETGEIFIETNYEVSSENVAVTGAHELGHLIDFALFRLSMGDYKTAREEECSLSGYADTALGEDFAEFCQAVISSWGNKEKLECLMRMYPGRYKALCDGLCAYYGSCKLKNAFEN